MPDDETTAALEEWRKAEAQMQAGHELRDYGKAFTIFDAAPPLRAPARVGSGLCACGATSPRLQSDVARRRWHGEHLNSLGIGHRAVTDVMLGRNAEVSPLSDDPAPALAGIREHNERVIALCGMAPAVVRQLAEHDVPRLVAAVEAVLKEHQPVNRGDDLEPICGTCHRGFWPCPTYRAITAALTGEEPGRD
jgi:hypothetical protein